MGKQGNSLKSRLKAGDVTFGSWVDLGSPTVAELLSCVGFDFLIVDLEHGQGDLTAGLAMIRAVQAFGTPCIVRVPSSDPAFIKRILDSGVDGIMVPQVETAEEAKNVVAACRYPPAGIRGYAAPIVRASLYGMNPGYMRAANDELLIIVQIESAAAVAKAESICAVEGIDVIFIGVNDLGGSIGRLEELDKEDVRAEVRKVEGVMRRAGNIMGTVPTTGATWQDLVEDGYTFIPVAADAALVRDGALAILKEVEGVRQRGSTQSAAEGD